MEGKGKPKVKKNRPSNVHKKSKKQAKYKEKFMDKIVDYFPRGNTDTQGNLKDNQFENESENSENSENNEQEDFMFNKAPILLEERQKQQETKQRNLKKQLKKKKKMEESKLKDYISSSDEEYYKNNEKQLPGDVDEGEDLNDNDNNELGYFKQLKYDLQQFFKLTPQQIEQIEKVPKKKYELNTQVLCCICDQGPNRKYVVANLPRNRKAFISLTETYNSNEVQRKTRPRQNIYNIGEYAIGIVVPGLNEKQSRSKVQISHKPSQIYQNLTFQDILKGQVLAGNVESQEDHGLRISFGIFGKKNKLQGFVSKENQIENPSQERQYLFSVLSKDASKGIVYCSFINSEQVQATLSKKQAESLMGENFQHIVSPGNLVRVTVVKQLSNGLLVSFNQLFYGYIFEDQLEDEIPQYQVNQQFNARIIYTNFEKRTIFLSNKIHHIKLTTLQTSQTNIVGQTLRDGFKIHKKLFGNSFIVEIQKGINGSKLKSLEEEKIQEELTNNDENDEKQREEKGEKIQAKSKKLGHKFEGESIKALLLKSQIDQEDLKILANANPGKKINKSIVIREINYFDQLPLAATKKELQNKVLNWNFLEVGKIYNCEIEEIINPQNLNKIMVKLKLAEGIRGIVETSQISDGPSTLKAQLKSIKVGNQIKAKIIYVNSGEKILKLTLKPSYMKSKDNLLMSYSQIEHGKYYLGTITKQTEGGFLVAFFNNIIGFLPFTDIEETHQQQRQNFKINQIITVYVSSYHEEKKKIYLTLSMKGVTQNILNKEVRDKFDINLIMKNPSLINETINSDAVYLGAVLDYKVEQKLSAAEGKVDYLILKCKAYPHNAIVLKSHLSDYPENVQQMFDYLSKSKKAIIKGKIIKIASDDKNQVLVTCKPSLLSYQHPSYFEDIKINQNYFAYISYQSPKGVGIKFNENLKGFGIISDPLFEGKFQPNETVLVTVKKLESEEKKIRVQLANESQFARMKLRGIYHPFYNLLKEQFILNKKFISSQLNQWVSIRIGNLIQGKVTLIKSYGIVLTIYVSDNFQLTGFITNENLITLQKEEIQTGMTLLCQIIDIDYEKQIIDLLQIQDQDQKEFSNTAEQQKSLLEDLTQLQKKKDSSSSTNNASQKSDGEESGDEEEEKQEEDEQKNKNEQKNKKDNKKIKNRKGKNDNEQLIIDEGKILLVKDYYFVVQILNKYIGFVQSKNLNLKFKDVTENYQNGQTLHSLRIINYDDLISYLKTGDNISINTFAKNCSVPLLELSKFKSSKNQEKIKIEGKQEEEEQLKESKESKEQEVNQQMEIEIEKEKNKKKNTLKKYIGTLVEGEVKKIDKTKISVEIELEQKKMIAECHKTQIDEANLNSLNVGAKLKFKILNVTISKRPKNSQGQEQKGECQATGISPNTTTPNNANNNSNITNNGNRTLSITLTNLSAHLNYSGSDNNLLDQKILLPNSTNDLLTRFQDKKINCIIKSISQRSIHPIYVELSDRLLGFVSAFSGIKSEILNNLSTQLKKGQVVKCKIIQQLSNLESNNHNDFKKKIEVQLADPQFLVAKEEQQETTTQRNIYIGQMLTAKICSVAKSGYRVQVSETQFGYIDITEVADEWEANPLELYKIGTYVTARVIDYANEQYQISTRQSIINSENWSKALSKKNGSSIVYKQLFQTNEDNGDLRNRIYKLSQGSLKEGMICIGYVSNCNDTGCFVKLAYNCCARAQLHEISDEHLKSHRDYCYTNRLVIGRIIKIKKDGKIEITLRESVVKNGYSLILEHIKLGQEVNGLVIGYTKDKALIKIQGCKYKGIMSLKHVQIAKEQEEQIKSVEQALPIGKKVSARIIKFKKEPKIVIKLGNLDKYQIKVLEEEQDQKGKESQEKQANQTQNLLQTSHIEELIRSIKEIECQCKRENKNIQEINLKNNTAIVIEGNQGTVNASNNDNQISQAEKMEIEEEQQREIGKKQKQNNEEEEEEDDDDDENDDEKDKTENDLIQQIKQQKDNQSENEEEEEEEQDISDIQSEFSEDIEDINENLDIDEKLPFISKKNIAKVQKSKDFQKREEAIRQQEQKLLEGNLKPQSPDDYEKLILKNPNSSYIWIQYVSYMMESKGIEQARSVIERALKVVNFRNEEEKLNIWTVYMNLESHFGTEQNLIKVFQRAQSNCKPKAVYFRLLDIYRRDKKFELLFEISKTMIKKFKNSCKAWQNHLQNIMEYREFKIESGNQNQLNQSHDPKLILQRALQSLKKRKHIVMLTQYSKLMYAYKNEEQGRTTVEAILINYPKRTDIWSIYIDLEIKFGNQQSVRNLLERCINLNLKPRKMKFFFKKYLQYEISHGCIEEAERVKQLANQYVQSLVEKDENEDQQQQEEQDKFQN